MPEPEYQSSNTPPPLKLDFAKPRPGYGVSNEIDATWLRLENRLEDEGASDGVIANVKAGFIAGVYASAAAIGGSSFRSGDISEAAGRIEKRRD